MPRQLRQEQNRDLLRQVNDRIADVSSSFVVPGEQRFICECAQTGCTEQVEVPLAVYALVRETPDTYLVLAGHEDLEHEEIVSGHGAYVIVRDRDGRLESRDVTDLSPAARQMLSTLKHARGGWLVRRECAPGATDPSHVLVYANQLRAAGHQIERRGQQQVEEHRLLEP